MSIRNLITAAVIGVSSVLSLACGSEPVCERDDPEEVVRGYLYAAESQDLETVWACLSGKTRDELEKLAGIYQAQSSGPERKAVQMVRFGHILSSTREYKKIELVHADDDLADVRMVLVDGSSVDFILHRDAGRWAVDLPL